MATTPSALGLDPDVSVELDTEAIEVALEELGWSPTVLGQRMGEVLGRPPFSRAYVHRLIRGQTRCSAEKWRAMAVAMHLRVPQLLLQDYGRRAA